VTAIDNLQDAIKKDAGAGHFLMDADSLTKGLSDPDVKVPEKYDDNLKAAFQVASASDFQVLASSTDVGPVSKDSFTVTDAKIPFLASAVQPASTIVFALDEKTLVVQIEVVLENWSWEDSFKFMLGWAFTQLAFKGKANSGLQPNAQLQVQFIFSTAEGQYPWGDDKGRKVKGGAFQNFFGSRSLPEAVEPVLALFEGLSKPNGDINLAGALDMSKYDGEKVLFPSGEITASLSKTTKPLKLLGYLDVSPPKVCLTIPPAPEPSNGNGDTDDSGQTPLLSVASELKLSDSSGTSPYILQVQLMPPIGGGGNASTPYPYNIGLVATEKGKPLTPKTIALLVDGGSYFRAVPSVLQEFLAFVGLQGLTLSGQLSKPTSQLPTSGELSKSPSQLPTSGQSSKPWTIDSVAVEIGSKDGTSWTPIPNAPQGLNFTIREFYLQWSILNIPDKKNSQHNREQNYSFSTKFTLAKNIFKSKDGKHDGVFSVEFTSELQFYATFEGTAKLSDFLATLTNNAVSLPSTIEASLSDIGLSVDYSAKGFRFYSGFDIKLDFLEVGDKPILSISDGQVSVSAQSPTQHDNGNSSLVSTASPSTLVAATANGDKTQWQSEISGLMAVGPLAANVKVAYDSTQTPARWNLNASLAQPIHVQELIKQFFDPTGSYQFPDFLPGELEIKTFTIEAIIPSGHTSPPSGLSQSEELSTSYSIETTFSWNFDLGEQKIGIDQAQIKVKYDGSKPTGEQFSGSASATWIYEAIKLELVLGYKFENEKNGSNKILFLEWEGFRAEYERDKEAIVFSLKGWSVGTLIQALVRTLGNPYFTLPSPWDLLDKISLDGLSVTVSLKSGEKNRLSASYTLSSSIDLGFIKIDGVDFHRDTNGKVKLAIAGTIPQLFLDNTTPENRKKLENLLGQGQDDEDKGQDVTDLPTVPGKGQTYFKLYLLILGQRIGIQGYPSFKSVEEVIKALEKIPGTEGDTNPVNPGNTKQGLPYYDQSNNWLIAAHLGLLKIGDDWTVDVQFVFNDPDLYGLRLALAGSKAGGLAGLVIDVLYKKITDDIGQFQIDFTFPDSIRNLNFGAVSVILPNIAISIYTNGDFLIDLGFPYNLDFTRSFSIAVVTPIGPVLGAGGLYIGKLSNATATQIPKTNKGTFNPVIVFGLGLQVGLGYNFTKGPLSAGFALTFFGIIEGVLAAWHPYKKALAQSNGALQDEYYFKISGTIGVIGLLYGKIDFAIIQATVNVKITLSLQIAYESYKEILLVAAATVDITVKVKIDLGLFSISISLSFSAHVSAKFTLGSSSTPPWNDAPGLASATDRRAALVSWGLDAAILQARALSPRPKRVVFAANTSAETLHVLISPQFTVLAPEDATDYKDQQGAFVFLLAMDAPDATKDATKSPNPGNSSFDKLCASYFPWAIDALGKTSGDTVNLTDAATTVVSRTDLEKYIHRLADNDNPPFTVANLLTFLQTGFKLNIETPSQAKTSGTQKLMEAGATLFPVFDGLSLSVPNASGSGTNAIPFASYTTANSAYRKKVSEIFAEVEAAIETQNQKQKRIKALKNDPESMAALIFVDTFATIGRQLLQEALNALDSYAYHLKADDSIESIITWAKSAGNALDPDDVALPNQNHPLSAKIVLTIPNLVYTIQAEDTLQAIATRYSDPATSSPRWQTTAAQLIEGNGTARVLQANVELTIQGAGSSVTYTTRPGDSFQAIAKAVGIKLDALANQPALYNVANLLSPAGELAIPHIGYTTANGATAKDPSPDTLNKVATSFATTVPNLVAANTKVQNLFSANAEEGIITLANLKALKVSDLWAAIQATDRVAQTAGMVSRFLLFGLRLPKEDGLTLSPEFLYGTSQKGYGLYQLTGQQFPTPASGGSKYEVTLSRTNTSHGVPLSFIEFNGGAGTSIQVDLTDAYGYLSVVLTWAQGGNFKPSPSLKVLPLSSRSPKAFATNNFSLWSSSDVVALQALTLRSSSLQNGAGSASQPQPTLWPLPSSLLGLVKTRQAALTPLFGSLSDLIPLMPQLVPQVGKTSPASDVTTYSDLDKWAWATRVDFEIKRLPAPGAAATKKTGAGSTPSGPALAASLPNAYEMVGPSSADSFLLEQLLSAMHALGEDLVSQVFLLYEQSDSATTKLVTLGSKEFLAFIAQTNLSTDTNPALSSRFLQATGDPPTGIANSPAQFIKLLWELSVVRSGGYYLYYEVLESGDGLPPSIFDTSGSATLSLLVTYPTQGAGSFGKAVLNFVNAFVSTDSIDAKNDVVQLLSQSASGKSAALKDTETLVSLSAVYGAGPGRIAEANSNVALASKEISVAGIVRQITDAATTLAELATYYSVGAKKPISAQDIQNFNPGVTVELGAVFYIPTINYVVSPATGNSAPGDTFAKMAAYYGMSVDAIATNAREVSGLFPAGTTLNIDTELFDLRSTLGPGNIGIALERVNPGEPPSPDPDPELYAKRYLYSLYNALSAGFEGNVFFDSSPWGLPFGPHTESSPDPAFTSHAQLNAQRRNRLQAGTVENNFNYRQSLGFGKFSKVNPAPTPASGLPPKSENPYIGVGSTAQVSLRWQDIFGNTTITPFKKVPAGYVGALNGSAATILYSDRLIGVDAWPNTLVSYIYCAAGKPVMKFNFAFTPKYDTSNNDDIKRAEQDLKLYQRVYFQLHQNYSGLSVPVPGVRGYAVLMSLSNSLLKDPNIPLCDNQANTVRNFVSACVQYLDAIVHGSTPPPVPKANFSLFAPLNKVAEGNVLPLNMNLTFERQARLIEPTVAALNDGLSVTSAILPQPDTQGSSYKQFATAFEQAFDGSQWSLKVGEGLAKQGEQEKQSNQRNQQLWAVRFGKQKGQGIYFKIGDAPSYYAPKPIAKSLESRTNVKLEDYASGDQITSTFTGVDLNLWFQTCLDAIDSFLSATYAPSAFILDKLNGTHDPLKDGYLGKILQAKQSLADSISSTVTPILSTSADDDDSLASSTVTPILSTSADDDDSLAAAREKFRQQLLNQLGVAYNAGAVVLFKLSDVSGAPPSTPNDPPNLYGQPLNTASVNNTGNQNYTLSSAKIPLGPVPLNNQGSPKTYNPRLAFVFTSKNVLAQAYVPLDLKLKISHLEFDRAAVPGIQGYVQSQWLVFVNGPFDYELGAKTTNVPVLERALPTPPSVRQQLAQQATMSPGTPAELTKWNYSFEYFYQQAPQDSMQVNLELNLPEPSTGNLLSAQPDLFQTLAQFVTAYPAINSDLNQYLTKIDGKTSDSETRKKAKRAVSKFQEYVTAVAAAYKSTLKPQPLVALAESPELVKVSFELALAEDTSDNSARTDVKSLKINGHKATWDPTSNTISNGSITLPALVVQIEPKNYQAEAIDPRPHYVDLAYRYAEKLKVEGAQGNAATKYLSYEKALGIPLRTIVLPTLDVLAYQNAWSSIYVQRNKILFPEEEIGKVSTTDDFLFQTPVVKFATQIVPRLVYPSFTLNGNGSNLETALNQFYAGLFSGNGQTSVEVSMTGAYSYQLLPNVQEVPRIILPISLLPPALTPVSSSAPPAFVPAVAKSIDDWRAQNKPTGANPQVNFKLQIFGASSAKQPLLTVDDLVYWTERSSGDVDP